MLIINRTIDILFHLIQLHYLHQQIFEQNSHPLKLFKLIDSSNKLQKQIQRGRKLLKIELMRWLIMFLIRCRLQSMQQQVFPYLEWWCLKRHIQMQYSFKLLAHLSLIPKLIYLCHLQPILCFSYGQFLIVSFLLNLSLLLQC